MLASCFALFLHTYYVTGTCSAHARCYLTIAGKLLMVPFPVSQTQATH
jgi:hypothetical protein